MNATEKFFWVSLCEICILILVWAVLAAKTSIGLPALFIGFGYGIITALFIQMFRKLIKEMEKEE